MEVRDDLANILLDGWPAEERELVKDKLADADRATLRRLRADHASDEGVRLIVIRGDDTVPKP
jgi:hypothetical protein